MELYIFFRIKNETTNIAINKQKFVQNSLFSESSHLSQMKLEKFFQMKSETTNITLQWICKNGFDFLFGLVFYLFCQIELYIFLYEKGNYKHCN